MAISLSAAEKGLTIIHTNDLHSYIKGAPASEKGVTGGWPRLATVIKEEEKGAKNPVIVVDAGDFLRGTEKPRVGKRDLAALILMNKIGYDVITPGNHDFDVGISGLTAIIENAVKNGGIPDIVLAGLDPPGENDESIFKNLYSKKYLKEYVVLNARDLKVGIFGIMGNHAARMIKAVPPVFSDPVKASARAVKILRNRESVDVVICLSHSGIRDEDTKWTEDEILAERVKGIDIIISGHSHTYLEKPRIVKGVIIVQAGEFGRHAGVLDVVFDDRVTVERFRIIEINGKIKEDRDIKKLIKTLM